MAGIGCPELEFVVFKFQHSYDAPGYGEPAAARSPAPLPTCFRERASMVFQTTSTSRLVMPLATAEALTLPAKEIVRKGCGPHVDPPPLLHAPSRNVPPGMGLPHALIASFLHC